MGGLIKLNVMPTGEASVEYQNQNQQPASANQADDAAALYKNSSGDYLDQKIDERVDQIEEYNPQAANESNVESEQAEQRLEQIQRYSHKILKKYCHNGMITMQDGPALHDLVTNRDYRIICILEVYSQNKLEDDFLENLGLLTQVIKEQKELEELEKNAQEDNLISYSGEEEFKNAEEEDQIQNDSFTLKIEESTSNGILDLNAANWCLDEKKKENRRVVMTYNIFKQTQDINDFANSLSRLYEKTVKGK